MKLPAGLSLVLASALLAAAPAAAQVCGDYARDAGEQCDDGNTRSLDGCDSACQFEQVHRVNDLELQNVVDPDAFCPANAFGTAFTAAAIGGTNIGISTAIQAGATSILFQFLGLDDLTGATDDASVTSTSAESPPCQPRERPSSSIASRASGSATLRLWLAPPRTPSRTRRFAWNATMRPSSHTDWTMASGASTASCTTMGPSGQLAAVSRASP